jgi:hypothetical protein
MQHILHLAVVISKRLFHDTVMMMIVALRLEFYQRGTISLSKT